MSGSEKTKFSEHAKNPISKFSFHMHFKNCTWLDFAMIGCLRSLAEFSVELLTLSNRESNWKKNFAVPMADCDRTHKLTYVHIEAATV